MNHYKENFRISKQFIYKSEIKTSDEDGDENIHLVLLKLCWRIFTRFSARKNLNVFLVIILFKMSDKQICVIHNNEEEIRLWIIIMYCYHELKFSEMKIKTQMIETRSGEGWRKTERMIEIVKMIESEFLVDEWGD